MLLIFQATDLDSPNEPGAVKYKILAPYDRYVELSHHE